MNHNQLINKYIITATAMILLSLLASACNTLMPSPTPTLPPTPSGKLISPIGYGVGMYYKSIDNQAFTISLSDDQGNLAILELVGELRWDGEGIIEEPTNITALRIQTSVQPDVWYSVVDTQIVEGMLIITTENGIFPLFTEGYTNTPIKSEIMSAEIVYGLFPQWRGPARLIITGLSYDFYGLIFMDTRNFSVTR